VSLAEGLEVPDDVRGWACIVIPFVVGLVCVDSFLGVFIHVCVYMWPFDSAGAPQSFISVRSMNRYDIPGETENCDKKKSRRRKLSGMSSRDRDEIKKFQLMNCFQNLRRSTERNQ